MDKSRKKRCILLVPLLLSLGGVILVAISLVTEHWVDVSPYEKGNITFPTTRESRINFGLFSGNESLSFGGFSYRVNKLAGRMMLIRPLRLLLRICVPALVLQKNWEKL